MSKESASAPAVAGSTEVESTTDASPSTQPVAEYILVALDASPHSRAALAAAVELATALHLELRGLFVEDIGLLHLCGLPFGQEIGSFTAKPRRLEQTHMEHEFRIQASLLRKIMADVAGQQRIAWSFQVVRGAVTDHVLAAATSAQIVSLGRVGHSPGKRIGSTARAVARQTQRPVVIQSTNRKLAGPFTVVHTGTMAAGNAVALALRLADQDHSPLTILVFSDLPADQLERQLANAGGEAYIHRVADLRDLVVDLRGATIGTVILPVDVAAWLDEVSVTVIVVP
jgi:nucleotide-binding universal stress UspA family protein